MNFLEEVKKTTQDLSEKLKGSDNYLTSSLVLAGTAVIIVVGILIAALIKPAFLPRNLQNQIGYNQTPTNTPTPTPTPIPLPKGPREFGISSKNNPQLRSFKFNEYDPGKGERQTVIIKAVDLEGAKITSIILTLISDHQSKNYPLKLTSGTETDGEWSGSWIVEDTHDYVYKSKITALNDKGQKSVTEPKFR